MTRTFEDKPAIRTATPLLTGLAGPSGSGKTYSMLRLLTGMQRVYGGDIGVIDTEAKRALHYADIFKFRHLEFRPPFGPLDYIAALDHFVKKGITLIGVDSMSHEHNGEGGVMDQAQKWLDHNYPDNEEAQQKNFLRSLKAPKQDRFKLTNYILQMRINGVFCYRAHEKVKPVTGAGVKNLGWHPETTSPLVYEMTARFLLLPACDGKPQFNPSEEAEKMLTKNPEQFRGWFKAGAQLTEDLGETLAKWSRGVTAAAEPPPASDLPDPKLLAEGEKKAGLGTVELAGFWEGLTPREKTLLKPHKDKWKEIAVKVDTGAS